MWKSSQPQMPTPVPVPEPVSPLPAQMVEPANRLRQMQPLDHAIIGKGLTLKGEITGTESLFIDGKIEGSVNIPNERVTIGQNGRVTATMSASMHACITAREIVIMGKVTGNVSASDRVEIRTEGTLTGDVSTQRISIADGAFFRGGVDIRKGEAKAVSMVPIDAGEAARTA